MASNGMSFSDRYGPWALIAGASDGVGAAYAQEMASRGINVVLLARRQALLDEVAAGIRADAGVEARPIAIDLAEPDAFTKIVDATAGLDVGMLMYNAGADPYYEHFLAYPVQPALAMIHRNCVVPTQLCHHFGGLMQTRGRGGIVLVSSAGGLLGRVNMVAYGGTKAFDLVFAEALWAEVHRSGVDVLAPILGATDTPALRRLLAKRGMLSDADDTTALRETISAVDVAQGIVANLSDGPIWYAGEYVRQRSEDLQAMPRNEAVRLAAAQMSAVMDTAHSGSDDG